ncbi:MAG: cation:proton antiporter [Acidimicrobiales bacterium]
MPELSFGSLLVVCLVAIGGPLVVALLPSLRVPAVVLEIVAGIVLGPAVLGWVEIGPVVEVLAVMGLAFLLFLAGLEIDLRGLRGGPLRVASTGFGLTLLLGLLVGLGLNAAGWVRSPLLAAIALSATSLGLVVPVLKDAGQAAQPLGQLTIAAASVADFGAIVALSLLFSEMSASGGAQLLLLGLFAALVVAFALAFSTFGRNMRFDAILTGLQDTTAEIRVRIAVALLVAFVALAGEFGFETILGAFLAGAIVNLVDQDTSTHPHFRLKLEAIGYGFLVPVFFVASGLRFDLDALTDSPSAFARVPVFVVALLVVRGVPAALYAPRIGRRQAVAAGLLQATTLPFLVTATQIGVALGEIGPATAAALVFAGLVSVVLFPPVAMAVLRSGPRAATVPAPGPAV